MSYEVPQQRRPGAVTAAAYLLFLVAVLVVVGGIVGLATLSAIEDATRKAYESAGIPNADQVASIAQIGAIGGAIVNLLLAAGFVVLGVLDLRGKNPARIVTWVLAGLGVLCFGCGVVGGATSGMFSGFTPRTSTGVNPADLAKQIQDAYPSWLVPVQTTLAVVQLLAVILVIILLALPASNAYFRKPAAPTDPGFPTYPQYGQPPQYGEPPAPGQPPYDAPPSA